MTHRVGTKGQVVIPKAIRDRIGIRPGDEVDFQAEETAVRIRRVGDDPEARRRRLDALRGSWAGSGGGGTAALEAERRREREQEERRAAGWGVDRP